MNRHLRVKPIKNQNYYWKILSKRRERVKEKDEFVEELIVPSGLGQFASLQYLAFEAILCALKSEKCIEFNHIFN